MSNKIVFISHFSGEAELATLLKETIEDKFLNMIDVFSSSHSESLLLGNEWFSTIKTNLSKADLVIVLCSPLSIKKPWVNFEAGCGFIRNIPVIPLCHSGLKPDELNNPLKAFQGVELNSADAMKSLFSRIATILDCKVPVFNATDFLNAVRIFEEKVKSMSTLDSTIKINSILASDLTWLKVAVVRSVISFDRVNNSKEYDEVTIEKLIDDLSLLKINFNDIYGLFDITPYISVFNMKVFQLLYEYSIKLIDNIKFILSTSSYKIAEPIALLFDELLANSSTLTIWYMALSMLCNSQDSVKNTIIKMIKEWDGPVEYLPSNAIDSYIDYYRALIFLHDWIIKYETYVNKILNYSNSMFKEVPQND